MKLFSRLFIALSVVLGTVTIKPIIALAHVKWFAESVGTVRPYQLTDIPVVLWLIVAVGLVWLGIKLEKKLHVPRWFHTYVPRYTPTILSLASIGFGAAFFIFP